ncbi:FKBPL protein, partial [Chunga burmeisteri]|nr:FKBPL protein [Chunga burmeisteri]
MRTGERAWFRPTGAETTLRVWLGTFSPPRPFWEESPERRWRAVLKHQSRAAALLKSGATEPAARVYARALRTAITMPLASLHPGWVRSKAELHAALALCQLRLGLPAPAAVNADKALTLQPNYIEARYRRAIAAAAMNDFEMAGDDLAGILREEPGHARARRELRRVRGAARERDACLARRLGRLFA